VERCDIECPGSSGLVPEIENGLHTDHVAGRLSRVDHVALHLVGPLTDRFTHVVVRCLVGPTHCVDSGVDHETNRPKQFELESADVAVGVVFIQPDFRGQALCIEGPSFDEGVVLHKASEGGKA